MPVIRRHLVWLACLWLCAQAVSLVAVSWSGYLHTSQSSDNLTCTCTHGLDANCPMHHHRKESSKSDCHCASNAPDTGTTSVVTFLGIAGVLTATPGASAPLLQSPFTDRSATAPTDWIAAPVGPPPRA